MALRRGFLALFGMVAASPAFAAADATAIPPPPALVQPVTVLLVFLAIFVAAAWSLSTLMGFRHRPARLHHWGRRRRS
jgi:hypothetical protein